MAARKVLIAIVSDTICRRRPTSSGERLYARRRVAAIGARAVVATACFEVRWQPSLPRSVSRRKARVKKQTLHAEIRAARVAQMAPFMKSVFESVGVMGYSLEGNVSSIARLAERLRRARARPRGAARRRAVCRTRLIESLFRRYFGGVESRRPRGAGGARARGGGAGRLEGGLGRRGRAARRRDREDGERAGGADHSGVPPLPSTESTSRERRPGADWRRSWRSSSGSTAERRGADDRARAAFSEAR